MHLPVRAALVASLVLLALACGGAPAEPVAPEPVAAAPTPSPAPAPAPERAGKHRKAGKHKAGKAVDASDPVAAYLADCHAVFPPEEAGEMDAGTDDECQFRPFDQNCAPDTFGCWDKGQSCLDACGDPCSRCQETCAGACDGCKEKCRGKAACERACAEERATCRDACTAGKDACEGACRETEHGCNEDADRRTKEKCPDCDAINSCLWKKAEQDRPSDECLAEHPGNARECLDWCYSP